jgi:AcrR family transcriptional regulator
MSSMSRAERKAETRRRLKEAAVACFVERGLDSTAVGTISKAAGVAHGTFYVHFPDKEALLDELVGDFQGALAARLEPVWAARGPGDPEALVRETAVVFLRHWQAEQSFVEAIARRLAAGLSFEGLRDGVNRPAQQLVVGWLAAWSATTGTELPGRAELVVQGVLAMWGRIGMQLLFRDDVSFDEAVEVLVQMTLGALGAGRGA